MNKNSLIGLLVAIIVIGGIYFIAKNSSTQSAATQAPVSNATNSTDKTSGVAMSTAVTPSAPTVMTNPNVGVSNSTAIVTGQVNPNGAATVYWFDYGTTTALGTESSEQVVGSGYALTATPAYITGLAANTLYYFRLSAKNSLATVTGTTYTFNTNSNPPPQGLAPTTFTSPATNVTNVIADLNGQINPNGSSTSYWFEYGTNTDLGGVTALQSIGSGTSLANVSISISNLEPLTQYYFRLNTQNQYGTVNGAILSFTTTGPVAPSEPSVNTTAATMLTTQSAQLTGRIDPNEAETTYWFQYGSDSLLADLIGSGTPQQNLNSGTDSVRVQADVTGLQSGTTYFYRLVGSNPYGTVYGNIVSFKTRS